MYQYVIVFFIIFMLFMILYFIDLYFDNKFKLELSDTPIIKIDSDCILIISSGNCPFCIELEDKIKNSTVKYTKIILNPDSTFGFDNTFTDLKVEERTNIINEVKKLILSKNLVFPSIIYKNKLYKGVQSNEVLNHIFNIKL